MLNRREVFRRAGILLGGASLASLLGEKVAYGLTRVQGNSILAYARSMIGVPYLFGSTNLPKSTDCSALTQRAYRSAGIVIPRTAAQQYDFCLYSADVPGALVFFRGTDPNRPADMITHVGINVGNGWMVDANSYEGKVVEEPWRGNRYWKKYFAACGTL